MKIFGHEPVSPDGGPVCQNLAGPEIVTVQYLAGPETDG